MTSKKELSLVPKEPSREDIMTIVGCDDYAKRCNIWDGSCFCFMKASNIRHGVDPRLTRTKVKSEFVRFRLEES